MASLVRTSLLLLAIFSVAFASEHADPAHEKYKTPQDRVHVHDNLGHDEEHFDDEGHHNSEYDHEAFAGEEADDFQDLEPEQAKLKLRGMAVKIDTDSNGKITHTEMTVWINKVMKKYVEDDADQQWLTHNPDHDQFMTWAEYKNGTYGFIDAVADSEEEGMHDILSRDRRRFDEADRNTDGVLSREEYSHFLHPEEAEHMRHLVVDETMEDLDKDKDGFLSLDEYIGEVHAEEDGSQPDWVKSEHTQFSEERDLNKDGKMDPAEVAKWILPQETNHATEEATHLIAMADEDKDGELTIDEMLNHHDIFVGSQATNYGDMLREEL